MFEVSIEDSNPDEITSGYVHRELIYFLPFGVKSIAFAQECAPFSAVVLSTTTATVAD